MARKPGELHPDRNHPMNTVARLLLTLCAVLSSYQVSNVVHAGEPVRLRVLSYNIHHGEGVDGKLDLQRIARLMLSVKPDLIAVQEVDRKVTRTNSIDQPAELARLTGMHMVFGANIKLQGGEYGNVILSRLPVVKHKNFHLPNVDNGEQRGVLQTEIKVPGRKLPLMFLATHFDYRRDERERLASVKMINSMIAATATQPALLAGDLNAVPGSKTLQQLATRWKTTNDKAMPTVPVKKPTAQIDFVLFRGAEQWKVIETKVLDEATASDHRAIFTVLELLPTSSKPGSPE